MGQGSSLTKRYSQKKDPGQKKLTKEGIDVILMNRYS